MFCKLISKLTSLANENEQQLAIRGKTQWIRSEAIFTLENKYLIYSDWWKCRSVGWHRAMFNTVTSQEEGQSVCSPRICMYFLQVVCLPYNVWQAWG